MSTACTRRSALKALAGLASVPLLGSFRDAHAQSPDNRYLFVVCAQGGADIRDAFLPTVTGEVAGNIRSHAPERIRSVGNFRCPEYEEGLRFYPGTSRTGAIQRPFLERHGADLVVVANTGTSVNHIVGSRRWLNGNGLVLKGRTLLESHALNHARADMPLPAVNLATAGFAEPGDDASLPGFARAENVQDALLFGLGTHPTRGVLRQARAGQVESLLERARRVREELDDQSAFVRRFSQSERLASFRKRRKETVPLMQELDLITQLGLAAAGDGNLTEYGLSPSPALDALTENGLGAFANDSFAAQAALAFLLVKSGASTAVSIGSPSNPVVGPDVSGEPFTLTHTPLAYDFSHTDHMPTQAAMWDRVLGVTDGLIRLLKATTHPAGGTYWERSLVYIATEFGRTLQGDANNAFGTGHELNNGSVLISPLLQGGRVFGGLDPDSGRTLGFNPNSGDLDPAVMVSEPELVATIAKTLGHTLSPEDESRVLPALIRG